VWHSIDQLVCTTAPYVNNHRRRTSHHIQMHQFVGMNLLALYRTIHKIIKQKMSGGTDRSAAPGVVAAATQPAAPLL
jgi:hypothetical protein